jgi:hypothetical protein
MISGGALIRIDESVEYKKHLEERRAHVSQLFLDRSFCAVRLPVFGGMRAFIVLETWELKTVKQHSPQTGEKVLVAQEMALHFEGNQEWRIGSLAPLALDALDEQQTFDLMVLGATPGLSFIDDHTSLRTFISKTKEQHVIPMVISVQHPYDVKKMIQTKLTLASLLLEEFSIKHQMALTVHRRDLGAEAQLLELRNLKDKLVKLEKQMLDLDQKLANQVRERAFLERTSENRDMQMLMRRTRQSGYRPRWHEGD